MKNAIRESTAQSRGERVNIDRNNTHRRRNSHENLEDMMDTTGHDRFPGPYQNDRSRTNRNRTTRNQNSFRREETERSSFFLDNQSLYHNKDGSTHNNFGRDDANVSKNGDNNPQHRMQENSIDSVMNHLRTFFNAIGPLL